MQTENTILCISKPIESLCQAKQPFWNRSLISMKSENMLKARKSDDNEISGIILLVYDNTSSDNYRQF